jgi:hypothetical protein
LTINRQPVADVETVIVAGEIVRQGQSRYDHHCRAGINCLRHVNAEPDNLELSVQIVTLGAGIVHASIFAAIEVPSPI